jgi:hypothetical protein
MRGNLFRPQQPAAEQIDDDCVAHRIAVARQDVAAIDRTFSPGLYARQGEGIAAFDAVASRRHEAGDAGKLKGMIERQHGAIDQAILGAVQEHFDGVLGGELA